MFIEIPDIVTVTLPRFIFALNIVKLINIEKLMKGLVGKPG